MVRASQLDALNPLSGPTCTPPLLGLPLDIDTFGGHGNHTRKMEEKSRLDRNQHIFYNGWWGCPSIISTPLRIFGANHPMATLKLLHMITSEWFN